jgi:hypothetical protein
MKIDIQKMKQSTGRNIQTCIMRHITKLSKGKDTDNIEETHHFKTFSITLTIAS